MVFYALAYPHAQLGVMLRYFFMFNWIRFPAWVALIMWLGLQILGASMQSAGTGGVGFTAHLGGAIVGGLWWFVTRKPAPKIATSAYAARSS